MSAGLLLLLYTAYLWLATSFQPGISVPMAQRHCTPMDIIKVAVGSPLHLECGSHCPTPQTGDNPDGFPESSFSWRKLLDISESDGGSSRGSGSSSGVVKLPNTEDPVLSIESVTHEDGGHYVCKCLPNGPECMYNVSVLPEMTFEASQLAVHYGDTFDLTCTVRGFPANLTSIQTRYGVELTNQIRGRLDAYTTRAFVPIMDSEEGEFLCVSESYLLGSLVSRLEKHLSITIYTPPVIIYTTEFVIRSQSDFGQSGQLTCTVQTSPDTGITVAWWINGSKIDTERSTKYRSEVVPMNPNDVMQYKLTIEDVQHSDIGSYLCQLSTSYRVEDSQEAWLQVDFRKGSDGHGGGSTHVKGEYQPNYLKGSSPSGRSDVIFFGVCSVSMVGVVLVLWKLATMKKGWRREKATPTINHSTLSQAHYSVERSLDDHAHSYGQQQLISLRRK